MKEYNLFHIDVLFCDFADVALEHYLTKVEYDQYYNSDFKDRKVALYWLDRFIQHPEKNSLEYELLKRSLGVIITSKRYISNESIFPGIDDGVISDKEEIKQWYIDVYQPFLLFVWDYLFDEPYEPVDLSQYIERTDEGFMNHPGTPELWGTPEYDTYGN